MCMHAWIGDWEDTKDHEMLKLCYLGNGIFPYEICQSFMEHKLIHFEGECTKLKTLPEAKILDNYRELGLG